MNVSGYWKKVRNVLRWGVMASGALFLLVSALALTRLPFDWQRWLGTHGAAFTFEPDYIVMAGGSGMPSESNLIRLYYTAALAHQFPEAQVVLLHPGDTAVVHLMYEYLIAQNVHGSRIRWHSRGTSTREQALRLPDLIPGIREQNVVVVTSPEHLYRALRTFRKAGFSHTGGVGAFEHALFLSLHYDHRKVGGKWYTPDVSGSLDLRYNYWNYLKIQINCYREWIAILYYKINGWI